VLFDEQRRDPRFCFAIVLLLDDEIFDVFAQDLSRTCDWGGSNLDANSLQSGLGFVCHSKSMRMSCFCN